MTMKGREVARRYGIKLPPGYGRGNIEHQWFCHAIASWLTRNGGRATVEDDSSGARVDVSVVFGTGPRVAFEVEVSPGHEVRNIEKDLGAGYDVVISLVKEESQVSRIRESLPESVARNRVEIAMLSECPRVLPRLVSGKLAGLDQNQNQKLEGETEASRTEDTGGDVPGAPPESEAVPSTKIHPPVVPDFPVESFLDAIVLGGNVEARAANRRKSRRRAPPKQERVVRTLWATGTATLDDLKAEFNEEWDKICSRRSGDGAKREFFRNMADLARRINDALKAGYGDVEARSEMIDLTGGSTKLVTVSHQTWSLALRSMAAGDDNDRGPSAKDPFGGINKNDPHEGGEGEGRS
jgi:hypothetical protein